MRITEEKISLSNVDIWAQCFGENSEKTIIFIAGAMAPAVFWPADFCNTLAEHGGYRVIRFDHRDIGYSSHFPPARGEDEKPPYSIDDMVEDVRDVLVYYLVKKAVVIGHSLGGTIATLFTLKYPHRVEQLFLLSSPIIAFGKNKYSNTGPVILDDMWKVLLSNRMYPDYKRGKMEFLKVWKYLNGTRRFDKSMAEEYTKRLYDTEIIEPAYNHTKIQNAIVDVYDELKTLSVPIHLIHGELDYLATNPENTKILAASLPNADFTLLRGVGHMYFDKTIWRELSEIIHGKTR